jgi:hypothetical protein
MVSRITGDGHATLRRLVAEGVHRDDVADHPNYREEWRP